MNADANPVTGAANDGGDAVGKRSGAVQLEQFQKEEYQQQLDPLISRLNEAVTGFKYDKKNLALLFFGLQQFLEDAFGVNAINKPFPKLPAHLFNDFSPDGPLFTAASLCADLMKAKGQKRIDWASPATRKENSDLVLRIRQELLRSGRLRLPKVHVAPACGRDEPRLKHVVLKLGGEVAQRADAPGVTHVVHPFPPSGDPDDGQPYLRTVEARGGESRVHWWYLPDSYNEWIPAGSAPEEVDADHRPPGGLPWHVYLRWVTDSDKYNEWMNEADYETEEGAAETKRAREAGDGEGEQRGGKRARGERKGSGAAGEVAHGVVEVLAPGAIRRRLVHPHRKVVEGAGSVIDISHGQRQEHQGIPLAAAPAVMPPLPPGQSPAAQQSVPAWASIIKLDVISQPERGHFPEFWTGEPGSRKPEQYKAIRNHLITRFRENPRRELTLSEALRGLDYDANDVRRIFDHLQHWGIINRQDAGLAAGAIPGGPQFIGADAILHLNYAPSPAEAVEAAAAGGGARVRPGTFRHPAPQPPALATGARFFCNAMPWVDCTALRWHCTKLPDVDLCPQAYAEGHFPPGCAAKDFIRVTAADAVPDASGWSPQETLLLLEGLEVHGDDWAAIAEHVGGKSQLQCVMHLLQLPMEESLLKKPGPGRAALSKPAGESTEGGAGAQPSPIPFADIGNPVMAQLAFLSSTVGPRVAAAAARGALEAISEEDAAARVGLAAHDGGNGVIDEVRHTAAAAAGLASASVKARLMADAEEREMQRLVLSACEAQLRRVQAKLSFLEAIDGAVKVQAEGLVGSRQGLVEQLARLRESGGGAAEQEQRDVAP